MKINSAIKSNLNVIFCIGETLKEKKNKKTFKVLKNQIRKGLNKIIKIEKLIIAYEPIWSIGTGLIPNLKELNEKLYTVDPSNLQMLKNYQEYQELMVFL